VHLSDMEGLPLIFYSSHKKRCYFISVLIEKEQAEECGVSIEVLFQY
jgi:hypothetical protein